MEKIPHRERAAAPSTLALCQHGRRASPVAISCNDGAILDNAGFDVLLEPEGLSLGSLNEVFAIESTPSEIFLLGDYA